MAAEHLAQVVQCRWMDGTEVLLKEKCGIVADIRRQVCLTRDCVWQDVILFDAAYALLSTDEDAIAALVCDSTVAETGTEDGTVTPLCVSAVIKVKEDNISMEAWTQCVLAHAHYGDVPGLRRVHAQMTSAIPPTTTEHAEHSESVDEYNPAGNPGNALFRAMDCDDVDQVFRNAFFATLGDCAALDTLLRAKMVFVDATDRDNSKTALKTACELGLREAVEILLAYGASVVGKNSGALHWASIGGHEDIAKMLLAHGASVNMTNSYGNSPLHWAARNGHAEICELLLDHKSMIDAQDIASLTPLHWAAWEGHADVARVLVQHGAYVNLKNKYGNTALHWSARMGHKDVTRVLLDAEASVVLQNKDGRTCLHDAVFHGYPEIVKLLMDAGADPHIQTKTGKTAMSWAHGFGREMVADILKAYDRGNPPEQEHLYLSGA
eukprot:GEMP01016026.1.p1 GENE.GEMP01016026.1~~GEMP01016026.1.p1  ORF type:complete len:438 (+),score=128.85 GEMP01016026.1:37-1350(+)